MILVTLGTQDKSFTRLLDTVQNAIDSGYIKEEVIVQAGYTTYTSKDMQIFDLISQEKLDELRNEASIIITHAGVGSILDSLKCNKIVIAMARLKKYHEHTNDHQLQILNNFYKDGYILKLDENKDLKEVLEEIKKFKPKKYKSNNKKFQKIITNYIDNLK